MKCHVCKHILSTISNIGFELGMGIIFHVSSRFLYAYFKINLKSGTGNGIRISLRFRIPDNIPSYSKSRTRFHQKIECGTHNPERTQQRTYRRAHRRNQASASSVLQLSAPNVSLNEPPAQTNIPKAGNVYNFHFN